MDSDSFSVRWTGQVEPLFSETYTFQTVTDEGVRLWVDNQLVIDQWTPHSVTTHTGQIALTAGQLVDIRMEYFDATGDAVSQLSWSSASQNLQIIPQTQRRSL